MLNKREILDKKKYIIERLKRNISISEKEKLESTLISLKLLEANNDKLQSNKLSKFIEEKLKGRSFLKPSAKFKAIINDVAQTYSSPINNEYLAFLIQIAENLAKIKVFYDDDITELKPFQIADENVINLSKKFYEKLKDKKYFRNVKIAGNTIEWQNGEDIAPENLYYDSISEKE